MEEEVKTENKNTGTGGEENAPVLRLESASNFTINFISNKTDFFAFDL